MSETNHEIDSNFAGRLNILRAGVLGANDGIISIAGVGYRGCQCYEQYLDYLFIRICSYFWPVPFQWQVENMCPFHSKKIPEEAAVCA